MRIVQPRRVALSTFTLATISAVSHGCGGKLLGEDVSGSLEDGGVFQLPDGAVLFEPGSGCATFNKNAWPPWSDEHTTGPEWLGSTVGCTNNPVAPGGQAIDADPACVAWAQTLGVTYPVSTFCELASGDNPSYCQAFFDPRKVGGDIIRCNLGPDGDAYCSAFFGQYVKGAGVAIARCEVACYPQMVDAAPAPGCWSGSCNGAWSGPPEADPQHICPDSYYVGTCVQVASECGGEFKFPWLPLNCVQRPGHEPHVEMFCADAPDD